MKRIFVVFMVITSCCGLVVAQDLPPDILADQYLLEATKALENGDVQNAVSAFQKIESLDIEHPLEYLFFYGKLLVEHSTSFDELNKGQSLLKKYVIKTGKDSEHYKSTLQLLSVVGRKVEEAKRVEEAVKALLVDGVDVNAQDKDGYTPLYSAAYRGDLERVKVLIAAGADVNAKNKNGYTPLRSSIPYPEVVKILIAAGADVNAKGSPLRFAAEQGKPEVVKILIAAGANVNTYVRTGDGQATPLWNAVQAYTIYAHEDVKALSPTLASIKVLIAAGADVNARIRFSGSYGSSPLDLAMGATSDLPELVAVLRAAGARRSR